MQGGVENQEGIQQNQNLIKEEEKVNDNIQNGPVKGVKPQILKNESLNNNSQEAPDDYVEVDQILLDEKMLGSKQDSKQIMESLSKNLKIRYDTALLILENLEKENKDNTLRYDEKINFLRKEGIEELIKKMEKKALANKNLIDAENNYVDALKYTGISGKLKAFFFKLGYGIKDLGKNIKKEMNHVWRASLSALFTLVLLPFVSPLKIIKFVFTIVSAPFTMLHDALNDKPIGTTFKKFANFGNKSIERWNNNFVNKLSTQPTQERLNDVVIKMQKYEDKKKLLGEIYDNKLRGLTAKDKVKKANAELTSLRLDMKTNSSQYTIDHNEILQEVKKIGKKTTQGEGIIINTNDDLKNNNKIPTNQPNAAEARKGIDKGVITMSDSDGLKNKNSSITNNQTKTQKRI